MWHRNKNAVWHERLLLEVSAGKTDRKEYDMADRLTPPEIEEENPILENTTDG